jgi:hypothetical protein
MVKIQEDTNTSEESEQQGVVQVVTESATTEPGQEVAVAQTTQTTVQPQSEPAQVPADDNRQVYANQQDDRISKVIRAGRRTYFFDVQKTTDGKNYLKITESRQRGPDRLRSSILVFPEDIQEFSEVFNEMAKEVK